MATTEERLAALETKLAALTATTPTTYYTHQYSGEEIDAAVGRAVSGGALDTSVTNVSNQLGTFVRPNLLDNWYFGDPVNQRGLTEYTGAGYWIDRWYLYGGTALIKSNTIELKNYASGGMIEQRLENHKMLAGKTLTLSVLGKRTGSAWYIAIREDGVYTNQSLYISGNLAISTLTFAVKSTLSSELAICFACWDASDVAEISAIKLELGPTQTLAHQENGVWVLNEVPDYGEQLRRCQRYFIRSSAKQYFSGATYASTSGCLLVPTPVQMRATPVISIREKSRIIASSGSYEFASLSVENADPSGVKLIVNGTDLPIGPFVLADTTFDLSADL